MRRGETVSPATNFTPKDREIRDAFLRNLQNEASRLGASDPEFAAMFDDITQDTAEGDLTEGALFLQAAVSAAVATVEEFLRAASPSPSVLTEADLEPPEA